jgi:iron complex outermembrane receptor protein
VINAFGRWRSVYLFLICATLAAALQAQQNTGGATLGGTVLDPSGKVLPNASVSVRNESNDTVAGTATTDEVGRFSVPGLPLGVYSIEVSAPGFATTKRTGQPLNAGGVENMTISLSVAPLNQTVTVEAVVSLAAESAPAGNTLDARSAKTEIPQSFIQNFTSPVSDYTEVVNIAPGTFGINTNGVGLGQSTTYYRGFADGLYTMTWDGIPFEDTNSPTHHSWAYFPGPWLGGVDFDRSPGTAATIGPTNFGGSINLLSKEIRPDMDIRATASYGSFNTRLFDLQFDSGLFGDDKNSLTTDIHQLLSDGYQTYNYQKRVAGSIKYQHKFNDKTTLTLFFGPVDLWTNTPNFKGPTRAQVALYGDNFLMNGDPNSPYYYGYNFYHVQTDFAYIGLNSDLGSGWKFDNKFYQYRYWNKQNYQNSTTTISATSGVDKLNGYNKFGDIMGLSKETQWGVFRTGIWYEWAYTDRYQIPTDPRTWVDAALPNFHEHFHAQTLQPYAEYEWRATPKLSITAGIKFTDYYMVLNQFADNGKTVGNLNGAQFVTHTANYASWLPSGDVRYRIKSNWTAYAQFGEGNVIPPSNVFDVKNAAVETLPKPTLARTYQIGTVVKFNRWTLDFDGYYIHFQNPYLGVSDSNNGGQEVWYQTGPSHTMGVEAESNIVLGGGFGVYLNATLGQAKYNNTGLWVANAPKNTETIGGTYQKQSWDAGIFYKRIASMWNDNTANSPALNQAIPIDAFNLTNVFVNYTLKDRSHLRGTKIGLAINNLFDHHNIFGVVAANTGTAAVPYTISPNDQLMLLPGRSIMVTLTAGFAPNR